jgi:hypothetical protein
MRYAVPATRTLRSLGAANPAARETGDPNVHAGGPSRQAAPASGLIEPICLIEPIGPIRIGPTNSQQLTTNNQQPTTNNQQPTTNNQQPTTNN